MRAANAPNAVVIPPPIAVPASIPCILRDVIVANMEPAATFPIAAWVAAAAVPATTPAVPKPNRVEPNPNVVASPPAANNKLVILLINKSSKPLYSEFFYIFKNK